MKQVLVSLAIIITINGQSQLMKKYAISSSGCSAYFFCNPGAFEHSYSEDSSNVYTGECKAADSLSYGIICVKLREKVSAGGDAENLMIAYLDYLKTAFNITSSAGYGKGHTLSSKKDARGVIDYWKDNGGDEWKVKGWTDGVYIAVLYVFADGKLNETNKVNVFLDSFRFPE